MAAALAGPDLQSRTALEESTKLSENKHPSAGTFPEVALRHIRQRRLATNARQGVLASIIARVRDALIPGDPRHLCAIVRFGAPAPSHVGATLCATHLAHKRTLVT